MGIGIFDTICRNENRNMLCHLPSFAEAKVKSRVTVGLLIALTSVHDGMCLYHYLSFLVIHRCNIT